MSSYKHSIILPVILYWGIPVVLIVSENEDGTSNIAALSSAWWIGRSCMLGLDSESKTTENILRAQEYVLNLADESMVDYVNKLAGSTSSNPGSKSTMSRHYSFVEDDWGQSGNATPGLRFHQAVAHRAVSGPDGVPIGKRHPFRNDLSDRSSLVLAIEVRVLRVHVARHLRMEGFSNRVDPDKWRPLIIAFQEFYGLRDE